MNHTERFLKALFFIELYDSDLWVRGCSLLAVVFKSRLVALSFWCFSCFWCFWYGALDTFEDLHLPFSITFKLSVSNCPAVSIPFVCKDRNFNLLKIGNPPPRIDDAPGNRRRETTGGRGGSFPQCVVGRRKAAVIGEVVTAAQESVALSDVFRCEVQKGSQSFPTFERVSTSFEREELSRIL